MNLSKTFGWLIGVFLIGPVCSNAQDVYVNNLDITDNKTTSVLFPYPIQSIDLGSPNILAQKVPGTENVLQIKADTSVFDETNVTVITTGGFLHQFNVRYAHSPANCYFVVNKAGILENIQSVIFNETDPVFVFEKAYKAIRPLHGKVTGGRNGKVSAVLHGIYVADNNLFFSLSIQNNSNISYEIESVKFVVKDRKRAKRTAVQENEICPIHSSTNPAAVPGKGSVQVIYTLGKFTIPASKQLMIVLNEKSGSRHIKLHVDSNDINNSQAVKIK